jgi:hypothetical protein
MSYVLGLVLQPSSHHNKLIRIRIAHLQDNKLIRQIDSTMAPKPRTSFKTRETNPTNPTYEAARNCMRNDTQTMDQTSDLPRDHVDAENALHDAESLRRNDELGRQQAEAAAAAQQTSSSSNSAPSASTFHADDNLPHYLPGLGPHYRDLFTTTKSNNPPPDESPSASDNNNDDLASAFSKRRDLQIKNRSSFESAENSTTTTQLFNIQNAITLKKGVTFEVAKAFKNQAKNPRCTMRWEDLILPEARTEVTTKLYTVQYHVFCPKEDDIEQWPKNSGLSLIEIADTIYKMYSPPAIDNKSLEQQLRKKPFAYDAKNEMVEIAHLGGLQEVINSNIGGIGMTDEKNDALARIIYKKIPTNCHFEVEFKSQTKGYLKKHNNKLDNVQATCFRIRNLLAEFRELGRKFQSFAPAMHKFRIKYED